MIQLLIAAGFIVGDYVYHRWFDPPPPPPPPSNTLGLPSSSVGASVPMIYGRIRVHTPLMVWWGQAEALSGGVSGTGTPAPYVYAVDMLFAIGVPFQNGLARVKGAWSGERQLGWLDFGSGQTGNGGFETPIESDASALDGAAVLDGGLVETMNGSSSFVMIAAGPTANTNAAQKMNIAGIPLAQIPGYRGYLSAFLYNSTIGWIIGTNPQPNAYSFEVTSYPNGNYPSGLTIGSLTMVGSQLINDGVNPIVDVNPIDVLWDLFVGTFGKLGWSPSLIDAGSFVAAAATLAAEGHGFSRSWETQTPVRQCIDELMQQVDGVIYEDPTTGQIGVKLIRADYDVGSLMTITPENCEELQNFAMGGWTGLANRVVVTWTDRGNNYRDNTSTAQSDANAVGQDGEVVSVTLNMPGVCTQILGDALAGRELQARSIPLMKCRAIVNRQFLRVKPGDAILLTWPEANISRVVMRVAAVGRGTLENGAISLDLVQDYFYQWRSRPPEPPIITHLGGILGGGFTLGG